MPLLPRLRPPTLARLRTLSRHRLLLLMVGMRLLSSPAPSSSMTGATWARRGRSSRLVAGREASSAAYCAAPTTPGRLLG